MFRLRAALASVAIFSSVAVLSPGSAQASPSPEPISTGASWLSTVNYFRAMSALGPVVENAEWNAGDRQHSCWMLFNGIGHDETPGTPLYSTAGDIAGNNGNVAVSSGTNESERSRVGLWMTGPFHAIGVLRHNLRSVGFGACSDPNGTKWKSGATLDVIRGLVPATRPTTPIVFPGNGMTTSLDRFVTETPNPLDFCPGWGAGAGLPVIAMMPAALTGAASGTMRTATGNLEVCVLSQFNTTGLSQAILAGDNAIVIIPRTILDPATYTVSIASGAQSTGWTFTIDPSVASPVEQPVPTTTALGDGVGMQPITPSRLVDTRISLGATRLSAFSQKRIQIGGRNGVPSNAQAVSANVTVVSPDVGSYLTVWNCSTERPEVSTLNFAADQIVPNGANIPLDSSGGLCVYSPSATDLVIDVNGYFSASATGRFVEVAPYRLMDSRERLASAGRLGAGSTSVLHVTGVGGVPVGASAVMLNVTAVYPDALGFVTVYPCGTARPTASNLNPAQFSITPNNVVSPVALDGTVCIFVTTAVDLVVDITGSINAAANREFVPGAPFRLIDTRDQSREAMQGGTGGDPVWAGQTLVIQVAGRRGIDAAAKAVSINVTAVNALGAGFLTFWACGEKPTTSIVNFVTSSAVANGGQVPLSATGKLCVFASNMVDVAIDVNGWWK